MSKPDPGQPGIVGSLQAFGAGLLESLRDRVELLAIELEEERARLLHAFLWIGAVMFAGAMALIFASLAVVYLFWDKARLAILLGLVFVYSGALVAVVMAMRRYFARQPRPFAATLAEIEADRACLRGKQ